jgi:hypothetical protein
MSGPFDYIQQNGCIKMLIGSVWGNHGCRGGGIRHLITFYY